MVIATGQKPADLKIPGTEYLTTSEQFLGLEGLPRRILFIGGGYIAFEFAHAAARAGGRKWPLFTEVSARFRASIRTWSINL